MISVCIATYNGEKYIKTQLESILCQIGDGDEVIISDDASTDKTIDIINSLNDSRINIYNHKASKSKYLLDYPTANFENAIMHSSGDIIFLADQDDVWLPEKVSESVRCLENSDIVVSGFYEVDDNLVKTSDVKLSEPGFFRNVKSNTNAGCCTAFKRHILDSLLPFPRKGIGHDFWIAIFGGVLYRKTYINKPLILYRRHVGNVTPSGSKSYNPLSMKLAYRFNELVECSKRYIKVKFGF